MDTRIVRTHKGKHYNSFGQVVIPCTYKSGCGNDTTMLGTKLCDMCWNTLKVESHRNKIKDLI